jgi:hypothetical protein
MSITDSEWTILQNMPEVDLVDLAIELDLRVPEQINHRQLWDQCLQAITELVGSHGLPLTQFNVPDLEDLEVSERAAIAQLTGLKGDASILAIIKAGSKIQKRVQRKKNITYLTIAIPLLLSAIARNTLNAQRP